MEPAKPAAPIRARDEIEMIGICKNDSCAELFERFLGESLDGRLGAHGHERGRLDRAMRRHPAPQRAPDASVFAASNEKFIFS